MTFRFANIEGRSALVDSDGGWFDASKVSNGVVHRDPMEAWLQLDDLYRAASSLVFDVPTLISYLSGILTSAPETLFLLAHPKGSEPQVADSSSMETSSRPRSRVSAP
jgi:hypothetical protein